MTERLRGRLLLAGSLALATLVVAFAFNPVPHSGGDNAGYLALAYSLVTNGSYTEVFDPARLPHTKYPPVFPSILAVLMALGARTWVAFKATAAVATVASVGLTFAWAERRLGSLSAFAVATLLALSTAVVYYSHWILSDPVFSAFTVLALVAFDRAGPAGVDEAGQVGAERLQADDRTRRSGTWLGVGVVAGGLALFTRSAGLPLVVAILGWLALERRWRGLAATAVAIGAPSLAWWWRGRGVGVASYAQEFWMVDPYQPDLGTVGIGGLVPRAIANLTGYVSTHMPGGIVGRDAPGLAAIGVAVTVATVAGWLLSARARVGPAELLFPLYAGLILLWPEVWSGDRFALPLYPLAFVYGAVALRALAARGPALAGPVVTAVAMGVLLVPAGRSWLQAGREARTCARVAETAGPFACWGPRVAAFADAATWAGHALPEGSAVLSRKPRHFFILSGVPSRTFPFSDDPDAHLALADSLGARYELFDQWDGQATRYVGAAVSRRPGAFCSLAAFGDRSGAAQMLGIVPPQQRGPIVPPDPSGVRLPRCPDGFLRPDAAEGYPASSRGRVPLLDGLDS